MRNGLTRRNGRLMAAALGTLAGLAAIPALAPAADGPFDPTCNGRVSLGEDRSEGQTNYVFACGDDIKGYAIVTLNRQTSAFDTEPVVLLPSGDPAPGQSFSCSGPIPGDGASCAGSANAGNKVTGHVNLSDDPCVGKRPEVALVVSNAAGATAGPFRLVNAKNGPAYRAIDGCPTVKPQARKQKRRTLRRHR